jgi:hypothetical protein
MSINDTRKLQIVKEGLRHTELRLEDLEKNATSAEKRLGWFATSSAAIAGFTFLYAAKMPHPMIAAISGLGIATASVLAVGVALPRRFHVRGHYWREWEGHIEDRDSLFAVLESQAAENDQRIDNNENELDRMARNFLCCFILVFWSICFNLGGQLSSWF